MPITFERTLCCNLDETISREWFIANGLGGYASGTIAGTLTRMQQGLLVAALDGEETPQLLLAKIDEEVLFDQRTYYLGTNEYRDSTLNPAGFVHLESFRLEEGFPIFTYRLGGANGITLEKRIWMPHEQNTTYIQYRVLHTSPSQSAAENAPFGRRGTGRSGNYARSYDRGEAARPSLTLTLLPFVAHRPYNEVQRGQSDSQFQVQMHQQQSEALEEDDISALALPRGSAGCTIRTWDKTPYHLLAIGHAESQAKFVPTGVWYWNFLHRDDQAAGLPATDDLYLPGVIRANLWPDQNSALTIIITAEELTSLPSTRKQINQAYEQALDYQRNCLQAQSYFGEGGSSVQTFPVLPFTAASSTDAIQSEEFLRLLYQAGDRLLVRRTLPYQDRSGRSAFFFRASEHIPTIVPGYYSAEDNTRAALIALPGLAVATRRYSEAQRMLRHLGRYFRQGLLPDRLPTAQQPELSDEDYGSADTTLWYFYALDKYLSTTRDYELLDELYIRLAESINCYTRGTFHGIQVDPDDGLLRINANERALTWMNAQAQGTPVTPRTGKPVEVNALWYHALSLMREWSQTLGKRGLTSFSEQQYAEQADLCRRSFNDYFWYRDGGYLYDVIDGPEGHDNRLRPNQLLAGSLRYAVLDANRQAEMLDIVTKHLVTPRGLRTLSPLDPAYQGQLPIKRAELPHALHQGGAWPWLIGPYIDTMLKVGERTGRDAGQGTERTARPDLYKEYIWRRGLQILEPFCQQMQENLLAHIGSVYSGDAPYQSGPELASALSVGEILRAYKTLAHMGVQYPDQALSV